MFLVCFLFISIAFSVDCLENVGILIEFQYCIRKKVLQVVLGKGPLILLGFGDIRNAG